MRGDSQLRAAVLTGAAVVLGAVIAASAGFFGQLALQSREDRRDDRLEVAHARGAARLLFAEFLQAGAQMSILANDRILRRFDPSYRIQMRSEDMRLVASKLNMEAWGDVQEAKALAEGLETFVNSLIERGRRRLTKGEACYALHDLRAVRYAAEGLADLADAEGKPPPPKPLRCKPKPEPLAGTAP